MPAFGATLARGFVVPVAMILALAPPGPVPSATAAPGMSPPPKRTAAAKPGAEPAAKPDPTEAAGATPSAAPAGKSPQEPATRPERPTLPPIPAPAPDGPLSRSDLIQMAIQSHPDFWRFRGEVAYYLEAEAAAYDWQDPELRIGFDHEFENDLEAPYEERRTGMTRESGLFNTRGTNSFVEDPSADNTDELIRGRSTRTQTTSQDRWIRTEEVIKVTPGKYHDILETTTYEVENRRERQRENRQGPVTGSTRSEKSDESSRRRVLSRTREVRAHPNSVYGDDAFVVQVRFFVPHPWDMRARAARARAEAHLSNSRLQSEVRDLVFDVGRRYDELQFRHAWHRANLDLAELHLQNLKAAEEETAKLAPLAAQAAINNIFDPLDVPRARLEVSKAREEIFDSRRELGLVLEELCLLCGLADSSRIVLTNSLRLRKLSEAQLDLPSLVQIARAHRPELGEMHARADVERARLREVKALRLPWFNDLRVGWQRTIGDGYRDQDEVTALLTFNLPMFSHWQNKAHRQHEEAIVNFEEARDILGQRIDQQVAFAIRAIQDAAAGLADFARAEQADRSDAKKIEAEAAAAGDRAPRMRLAAHERLITSRRGRLQALYYYNQAVARLEQAIGVPIEDETVFSGPPSAK